MSINAIRQLRQYLFFIIPIFLYLGVPGHLFAEEIRIMTYNVENLFDANDDPGKDDKAFLPLHLKKRYISECQSIRSKKWRRECLELNWDQRTLEKKLKNLAKVIDSANPDILMLQEVENNSVLSMLRDSLKKKGEYKTQLLLEGGDHRGIDQAVLSKLELVDKAVLHKIPFQGFSRTRIGDTRSILEVKLRLPGNGSRNILAIFNVHFPAPYHPSAMRKQALQKLINLMQNSKADYVLAGGDFNITSSEEKEQKFISSLGDRFLIPHLMSCRDFRYGKCKGSYYYRPQRNWSQLDIILLSKNFSDRKEWELNKKEILLFNKDDLQIKRKYHLISPASFNPRTGQGVSDHWPLLIQIEYSDKRKD